MPNNAMGIRLATENMRSATFDQIGAAYIAIGTGLLHPSRLIKFDNLTNVTLTWSDDGINDKWQLPAQSSLILDETSNATGISFILDYAIGTVFWVKAPGAAATSGQVNVSTWYAQNP